MGTPPPGEDYPRNQTEFEDRFRTEGACEAYLIALKWPDGFACPACQGRNAWRTTRGRLECAACHRQVSITAGTVFHKTRKPLRLWFQAMWWLTSQKYGANALGLQRLLGLGSYQTAWTWLHKLRRAMVRPGRDRLTEEVEVDETYLGGEETGVAGRQTDKKAIIAIAAEVRGKGIGRIRLARVKDASAESLVPFVRTAVCDGAIVRTDAWRAYNGLAELGYKHRPKNLSAQDKPAHVVMPRVHRVASLLKRWWLGTYQGGTQLSHLDYYLDEFTFRFNRRTSGSRGKLFYRLMQQAVTVGPTSYRGIVGGCDPQPLNRS